MSNKEIIRHPGTVVSVDSNTINVMILNKSACVSCHAKGLCNVSEMEEKIVEIPRPAKNTYNEGDRVEVIMRQSLGLQAVLMGYFLPFLLFLITLIVSLSLINNEGVAALLAIGILIPYYMILALNKNTFKKTFGFQLA